MKSWCVSSLGCTCLLSLLSACASGSSGESAGLAGQAGDASGGGSGATASGGTHGIAGSSTTTGGSGATGTGGSKATGGSGASTGGNPGVGGAGTGGAGTGGSGASAPHVVLNCSGLGDVGVWEKISPNDYTSHGLVVDPINAGTVYMGAGQADAFFTPAGVWKTTDCGATWTEASGTGSNLVNSGRQWSWLADPVKSGVVYTTSGYGANGFYKSTNGGMDWFDVTPKGDGAPGFVGGPEQMDPEDSNHILVTWHQACRSWDSGIGCFAESTDGGSTWVEHYRTPDFVPEVRPYLLHGKTWVVASGGLLRTTDGGVTWTKVSDAAAGGHSSGSLYRSSKGDYYIGGGNGVVMTTDDGLSFTVHGEVGQYIMGITGDGTTMFASGRGGMFQKDENPSSNWSTYSSPFNDLAEGCYLGYDQDHHLLYASCHGGSYPNGTNGLWRVRTK